MAVHRVLKFRRNGLENYIQFSICTRIVRFFNETFRKFQAPSGNCKRLLIHTMLGLLLVCSGSAKVKLQKLKEKWDPVNGYCLRDGKKPLQCDMKCALTSGAWGGEVICYDPVIYGFCQDVRIYYFALFAPWVIIILVTMLISCCCCKVHPTPCLFFLNFLFGAFWSLIICAIYCLSVAEFDGSVLPMIIVPVIVILQMSLLFICGGAPFCRTPRMRPHFIFNMMKSQPMARDDFKEMARQLRRSPPIVLLDGRLFTRVVTTTRRKGKTVTTTSVVTTPFTEESPYCSWEERGKLVEIPKSKSILFVTIKAKFKYTQEMLTYTDERRELMKREVLTEHPQDDARVDLTDRVQGLVPYVIISTRSKTPSILKFTSSKCGRYLWYILHMFGFGTVYEAIFCAFVGEWKFKTKKWISGQPDFHCPAYEPDLEAPTFKHEDSYPAP